MARASVFDRPPPFRACRRRRGGAAVAAQPLQRVARMFRKPRRQRPSGSEPPSGGLRPPALAERLRQIAAAAEAPEDALEPALRAVVEASGARAGAVCLFDPRQSLLRLAAEAGLSDEGCRRLRCVRRADPASWDMPLHGLLNRRAYLIESASKNRYVPRLVEPIAAVRTIACVPLYRGPTPLGSVVLVAMAPRSFAERDIRALERPLREVARMIEAVRRRGAASGATAPLPEPEPARPGADVAAIVAERDRLRGEVAARLAERACLAAELTARTGEAERLRAALDGAASDRDRLLAEIERGRREAERVEALTASLAAAEHERARLAAALETAAAERAEQARLLSALERGRAEAERAQQAAAAELESARRSAAESASTAVARAHERAAEVERLQARLAEAHASLEREREHVRAREREQERIAGELRATGAREQRLREELAAATQTLEADREDDLREALARTRAAEEAHAAAVADAEAAHAALTTAQAVVEALEDEATQAHARIARLETDAQAEAAERARLAEAVVAAEARAAAVDAQRDVLEREAAALRDEAAQREAALREREAESASLSAHLEALAAERDRLREAGEALAAERDRVGADAATAASAQTRLEEVLARETAERARLAAALGTAQAAVAALESAQAQRDAEAAERAQEIARLRAECDRLAEERDAARAARPATPEPEPESERREALRVVTVAPTPARGRVRDLVPGRRTIAVIDADASWEDAAVEGHQVVAVAPGPEAVERVAGIEAERVVVNLAAPGALETLAALRARGSSLRFWGCLASPESDRALRLAMVEPAPRPLDCDAIIGRLAAYAARGTRIVTAGPDVDALMSLRQALSRRHMSVSMAWDAKQATELLGVVRPSLVVVDLALPRRDGYLVVARLGTADPVPNAVLIPGTDDPASGFAAALFDPANVDRAVPLAKLLADAVTRAETAGATVAAERRPHKVRALGRK
jgi:CheY-like chemotaxis protein